MTTSITPRVLAAGLLAAALIAASGCVRVELPVPEYTSDTDTISRDGATELVATIDMGAGQLRVSGGASGVMDADFEFSDERWRPQVSYEVSGGEGRLAVRTPSGPTFGLNLTGQMRYAWDIALPDDMPLDLSINMGAGESRLDLGTLDLRRLQVNMGAGDSTIDLSGGEPTHDMVADINGGAGAFTLRVPADVGVRIVGHQDGLGSYQADGFIQDGGALVNRAYDDADVRFEITLRRGIGDVTVETVE